MSIPTELRTTLRVTGLFCYPVKSCAGFALDETVVTSRGWPWDREWMVVRPDGTFVTQRQMPRMALVRPHLTSDSLRLEFPDRPPVVVPLAAAADRLERQVTVWKHTCPAFDEGDGAAEWLSGVLGISVRLVRFRSDHRRLSDPSWTQGIEAENRFSDGYPILVISEESLADLNARIGGPPLPMDRFRPNLVVAGAEPYVEDRIGSMVVDGLVLRLVKPCTRCRITTTDQATAEVGAEPLATLATYRRDERLGGVVFGQNVVVAAGVGRRLAVGMKLQALPTTAPGE